MVKILAILTLRNEAAFLLEWLAHHRAAGITDFLVFSNDCQDGTDAMLNRLDEMGLVTHVRNDGPYGKGGIQFTAYKLAEKHPLMEAADWVMTLDVDEFVNIHCGTHRITDLISALPEATAITLTWRLFGNAGIVRYADTPVTDTFLRAAPVVMHWPWRAAMFKTLYRNDGTYTKLGVHRPRQPDPARVGQARWFDGEGRELDRKFATGRVFSNYGQSNYALAQLNHYALGAMESYVLKAARGRAVHSDHMLDLDYWVERNFNTDMDRSIQALSQPMQAELEWLKSDPDLSRLHDEAVAWRKTRFMELMLEEPYRALFGRLLTTPPSRPVSQDAARFLTQFANLGRQARRD
ncbi:glycosyltransferase family 92 protein [Rhodobacteraceae bacterium GS-10]|uniref:Glycosyltransferase family 92 protein n=1 Tax=Thalassovita mangrovi TaxID=2692236 RepID=A0A6L8LNA2_9RHOB|nr:glycosyltransferase family 92 protein [Thalassovita mangrovi]